MHRDSRVNTKNSLVVSTKMEPFLLDTVVGLVDVISVWPIEGDEDHVRVYCGTKQNYHICLAFLAGWDESVKHWLLSGT